MGRAIAAALALLCTGCIMVTPPGHAPLSGAEIRGADYGLPISQGEAEALATAWLGEVLRDPESMRATWGPVREGWQRGPAGDVFFGYRMEARINAKNAYGGYTGAQSYLFLFRDGALAYAGEKWDFGRGGFREEQAGVME